MSTIRIAQTIYNQICATIGCHKPECGGILGADESGIITHYYFDHTGKSTANSYIPDVQQINRILMNEWMPQGVYMVGIVHSHTNHLIVPSCGDIEYGVRILQALDTVSEFYLPIVVIDECIKLYGYVIASDSEHQFVCRQVECEIVNDES